MDFLKNHFEKVILGVLLLGVLIACGFLLKALAGAEKAVTEVQQEATRSLSLGGQLNAIRGNEPAAVAELIEEGVALNVAAAEGGLLKPRSYVICINERCRHLLDFNADRCKYCQAELPPAKPDEGEDTDGDGIPDYFERQYAFLDPNDPTDARKDYDGDGFLNVEEFRWGTRMDDPSDVPPLAVNLRYMKLFRKPIPIRLSGITTFDSTDQERWNVSVITQRAGRPSKSLVRIGQDIGNTGYKLISAEHKTTERKNPRTDLMETVDVSSAVIEDKRNGKKYTLEAGQTTYEEGLIAQLLFLSNRYDPRRCQPLYVKKGTEFPLTHAMSKTRERYVVTELQEDEESQDGEGIVRVRRLNWQKDGQRPDEDKEIVMDFDLAKLSPDDFIKEDRTRRTQAGQVAPEMQPRR